jgi:hypothetical protein
MRDLTPLSGCELVRIGFLLNTLGTVAALANVSSLTELNSLRAANGLPAGIAENPAWSAGCAAHMHYLELNDYAGDWHTEVAGRPGYSAAGKQAAGSAVLTNAPSVGLEPDWEATPFHYAQLLAPKLSVSGSAPGCIYTWPGYRRPEPAALTLYPFPGDGVAGATSPYLYAFAFGGGVGDGTLSDASITGPDGPIEVNVIDNHTPGAEGYLPPGGVLAPAQPLEDDTAYTAEVTFSSDEGAAATRRWSFSTGELGAPTEEMTGEADPDEGTTASPLPSGRTPRMTLKLKTNRGGARATVSAQGNAVGRTARITLQRTDCRCRPAKRAFRLTRSGRRFESRGRPVRVTVSLPGFFADDIPYRGLTLVRTLS